VLRAGNKIFDRIGSWWTANRSEILKGLSEHQIPWIFALTGIGLMGALFMGGVFVKNGIIFGVMLLVSSLLLLLHGGVKNVERLKWLARYKAWVDGVLAVLCGFVALSAGITAGIGAAVFSITTSLILHALKDKQEEDDGQAVEA